MINPDITGYSLMHHLLRKTASWRQPLAVRAASARARPAGPRAARASRPPERLPCGGPLVQSRSNLLPLLEVDEVALNVAKCFAEVLKMKKFSNDRRKTTLSSHRKSGPRGWSLGGVPYCAPQEVLTASLIAAHFFSFCIC